MPHWAEGRHVGIFPDVPGKFRAEHSIIITTEEMYRLIHEVVSEIFNVRNNRNERPGG